MPLVPVKKDEELSCNYGYPADTHIPWFREEYKRFQREHPDSVIPAFDQAFWKEEQEMKKESD